MELYAFVSIIVVAILAVLPASIAERKGKNFGLWYLYGFCIWIVAILHAISLPEENKDETRFVLNNGKLISESGDVTEVDINTDVQVEGWRIFENENKDLVLKLRIRNTGFKVISSVKFRIFAYNSLREKIVVKDSEYFEVLLQDLKLEPLKFLDYDDFILLPDKNIRIIEAKIEKIAYEDGIILDAPKSKRIKTCQNPITNTLYLTCIQDNSKKARFFSYIEEKYWQCTCGYVNKGDVCAQCSMSKKDAEMYTLENIEETYNDFIRMQNEHAEKRKEEKQKKKKKILIAAATSVLFVFLIAGVTSFVSSRKEELAYEEGKGEIEKALQNEDYDKAFSVLVLSDAYKQLDRELGSKIYEKEMRIDENYTNYANINDRSELKFRAEYARGGITYYLLKDDSEEVIKDVLYAVSEDNTILELFTQNSLHSQLSFERTYVCGVGNHIDFEKESALWSAGWVFIQIMISKKEDTEYQQWALKYDVKKQEVLKVELTEENNKDGYYSYLKMRDGNIVILPICSLDDVDSCKADNKKIRVFDVKEGVVNYVSYEDVLEMYDNNMRDHIIYNPQGIRFD